MLGAGPGGYSAAFRSADLGMKTVLVERYATLGGVCLNVGCIPSKALLHTASVMDEVRHLPDHGIKFGAPEIDLDKLRGFKDGVVKKLTGGLAGMAKARKVEVVTGVGSFLDPHHLEVVAADGSKKVVKFAKAIIAAGSQAVKLPFMPEDERVVDSTGALLLKSIPKRMLVIGGGIIGLEMATVYSTLGTRIDVVEMLDGLMQGADRDLVKVWEKMNAQRFDNVMLKTKTVGAKATTAGIEVAFEGEKAPKEPQLYDLVLVAVGRSPNGKKIGADKAGVAVTDRGFINVDKQMRTNVPHIFAIGDIVGQPMLAHKAVHEAHVAAEVAHGEASFFDARQIPSVAYTDPEVAWAGKTEEECKAARHQVRQGGVPLGGIGPRHRQRPRRGLHQADLRRGHAPRHRRRHRRHACRRPDRRGLPGHRDGLRAGRHRQDHPPAPDAGRIDRHGRRGLRRPLHRPAAGRRRSEQRHATLRPLARNWRSRSTGSGPPLVILHGLFGSGNNWRGIARGLAATHRVLTVDLRNHGASPWADTMGYFEMADDVQRLIEREGLRQPAVMGHSMGGKVAMALALLHPQCVGRLIVVDIAPVAYADRLSPFAEAMRGIDMLAAASRSEVQQRLAETVPDTGVVPFLMQNLVMRNAHLDWRINLAGIAASIGDPERLPARTAQPALQRAAAGDRGRAIRLRRAP